MPTGKGDHQVLGLRRGTGVLRDFREEQNQDFPKPILEEGAVPQAVRHGPAQNSSSESGCGSISDRSPQSETGSQTAPSPTSEWR